MIIIQILRNTKGFTLIEFIITVVVVGILIQIAVPNINRHKDKGEISKIQNDSEILRVAMLTDNSLSGDDFFVNEISINEKENIKSILDANRVFKNGLYLKDMKCIGEEIYHIDKEYISSNIYLKLTGDFFVDKGYNIIYVSKAPLDVNIDTDNELFSDKDIINNGSIGNKKSAHLQEKTKRLNKELEELDKAIEDSDITNEELDRVKKENEALKDKIRELEELINNGAGQGSGGVVESELFTYQIDDFKNKTATITGPTQDFHNNGGSDSLKIPGQIKVNDLFYEVNHIESNAFAGFGLKENVSIPNTISTIGDSAFKNNRLDKVNIPDSVKAIGSSAFEGNRLEKITVGNNVSVIDNKAFSNNRLEKVDIPNSVKVIGPSAFEGNKLEKITIGNGVSTIDNKAFINNKLERVNIPGNVKVIGSSAFEGNKLERLTLGNGVSTIDNRAFINNKLERVNVPDSVKAIGSSTFEGNGLKGDIYIPDSVEFLGDRAFRGNSLNAANINKNLSYPSSVFDSWTRENKR